MDQETTVTLPAGYFEAMRQQSDTLRELAFLNKINKDDIEEGMASLDEEPIDDWIDALVD